MCEVCLFPLTVAAVQQPDKQPWIKSAITNTHTAAGSMAIITNRSAEGGIMNVDQLREIS